MLHKRFSSEEIRQMVQTLDDDDLDEILNMAEVQDILKKCNNGRATK